MSRHDYSSEFPKTENQLDNAQRPNDDSREKSMKTASSECPHGYADPDYACPTCPGSSRERRDRRPSDDPPRPPNDLAADPGDWKCKCGWRQKDCECFMSGLHAGAQNAHVSAEAISWEERARRLLGQMPMNGMTEAIIRERRELLAEDRRESPTPVESMIGYLEHRIAEIEKAEGRQHTLTRGPYLSALDDLLTDIRRLK